MTGKSSLLQSSSMPTASPRVALPLSAKTATHTPYSFATAAYGFRVWRSRAAPGMTELSRTREAFDVTAAAIAPYMMQHEP